MSKISTIALPSDSPGAGAVETVAMMRPLAAARSLPDLLHAADRVGVGIEEDCSARSASAPAVNNQARGPLTGREKPCSQTMSTASNATQPIGSKVQKSDMLAGTPPRLDLSGGEGAWRLASRQLGVIGSAFSPDLSVLRKCG